MKEEKIEVTVNQEDVQNIIDCYEKDIEYIKKLEEKIDKAIEYIEKETEGRDSNPIEGSWLYDLLKVKEILKGEKE